MVDPHEKLQKGFEWLVVPPAIDVLRVQFNNVLTESFSCEPSNAGLPHPRRSMEKRWFGRVVVEDWFE